MALAERLSQYGQFARFLAKYGRGELTHGVDSATPPSSADTAVAEDFARDVEALGPTFIKFGQLLSTRADVLRPSYREALARLQDDVDPFPYAEVVRIVEEELGVRLFARAFRAAVTAAPRSNVAGTCAALRQRDAGLRSGLASVAVGRLGVSTQSETDSCAFPDRSSSLRRGLTRRPSRPESGTTLP